jgi:xylulokinase
MTTLGIDIGSSSVKAGLLRGTDVVGKIVRRALPTDYTAGRAEVKPDDLLTAVAGAVADLGSRVKRADAVGLSVMSPSWVAMDARGRALTPIVTHQDRRSVAEAHEIERRVGRAWHLRVAGLRPFPGGVASTTLAWFVKHEPRRLERADLAGNLNTFLHRAMTAARVTDPSNASFTGLYETIRLGGWSDVLIDAAGANRAWLPDVLEGDVIAGNVSREGARRFNLPAGLPVMTGVIDGSAIMLLAGAGVGQLVNSSGSTDVLALCTDRPRPHPQLLTRALGVGRRWLHVATIAAAGSSLNWAKDQLFADLPKAKFWKLVEEMATKKGESPVTFDPYLAGERTSVDQRRAAFTGLTLSTTRQDMLEAVIEALARASADRVPLLQSRGTKIRHNVFVSGGVQSGLADVLHRDWPGRWTFHAEDEATLRGLGALTPRPR